MGCDAMFVIQPGSEFRDLVRTAIHRERVVLRLEPRALFGLVQDDAGSFAGGRPVGGAFESHDAVEDTAFRVADLVRVGLPDSEVRGVPRRILYYI